MRWDLQHYISYPHTGIEKLIANILLRYSSLII